MGVRGIKYGNRTTAAAKKSGCKPVELIPATSDPYNLLRLMINDLGREHLRQWGFFYTCLSLIILLISSI